MPLKAYRITITKGSETREKHVLAATTEGAYDRMREDGEMIRECAARETAIGLMPVAERLREIASIALAAGIDPERIGSEGATCAGDAMRMDLLSEATRNASTSGIGIRPREADAGGFEVRGRKRTAVGPTLRRAIDAYGDRQPQPNPADDRADTIRFDWLATEATRSPTGVSLDRIPSCDGEPGGYRFMRRHWIGPARRTLREAIDDAMAARDPKPAF